MANRHTATAQALEGLYAGRLEDAYDHLAYHYSRAEQAERAVEYLERFTDKVAHEHAHVEAILALQGALAHGERLPAWSANGCSSICTCGWRCPCLPWVVTRKRCIASSSSTTAWGSSTTPG